MTGSAANKRDSLSVKTPPRRTIAGLIEGLRVSLSGSLTTMPSVADTGQAEAHQCEGGGFGNC